MSFEDFTWTPAKLEQLLELVKERPLLWSTDTKTSNRSTVLRLVRQKLWDEVAEKLGIPPDCVEKKTQRLKSQFNRETRRIRVAMAGNKPVKTIWFGYYPLMFMIHTANDYESIVEYIKDSKPTEKTYPVDKSIIHSEMKEEHERELAQTEFFDDNNENDESQQQPSTKHKRNRPNNTQDSEIFDYDHELFGSQVADRLRNIKDEYMRNLAQLEINAILAKAKLGQL